MSKKDIVIHASRNLFSAHGFKKVTMDEIAKESRVTKKTIYSYFKDKNDLIKYFLYEEIDNMKNIVNEIDNKSISAIDKVNQMIYSLLEYRKDSELLNKFNEESLDIDRECLKILNDSIISEIKNLLEKGISSGEINACDVDLVSFLIYKLYVAVMFEWDKPIEKDEVTQSVMKFLKEGLFK